MTLNDIGDGPSSAHCACQVCCVSHAASSPPPPAPMHMYGQRAAQNGRWVSFFVTKCRDLFCDQGGGVGGGSPPPPRYIHPCSLCREATAVESAWTGRAVPVLITCLAQKDSLSFELIPLTPPPPPPHCFGDPVSPNQPEALARISGFLRVAVKKTIY